MKMSKELLKQIRAAKSERALVNVLRKIIKEYVNLDREDMSVIRDIIGMLKSYGWEFNKHERMLFKEGQININLSTISFK